MGSVSPQHRRLQLGDAEMFLEPTPVKLSHRLHRITNYIKGHQATREEWYSGIYSRHHYKAMPLGLVLVEFSHPMARTRVAPVALSVSHVILGLSRHIP